MITVYRTHLSKKPQYEKKFLTALFEIIDVSKRTIINGDFNFDFWDEQERLVTRTLRQTGFIQIVKEPTTVRGNCIDHFYLPSNESNFDYKLYYPYYADHEAIMVIVKDWTKGPTRSQKKRQLKKEQLRKNKSK